MRNPEKTKHDINKRQLGEGEWDAPHSVVRADIFPTVCRKLRERHHLWLL